MPDWGEIKPHNVSVSQSGTFLKELFFMDYRNKEIEIRNASDISGSTSNNIEIVESIGIPKNRGKTYSKKNDSNPVYKELSYDEHFERVDQTTQVVWPVLEKIVNEKLDDLGSAESSRLFKKHMDVFLNRRANKRLLRPYLSRIAYEAAGGVDWEEKAPLFAAAELFNISTYQSNLCFDKKYELKDTTNDSSQFMASMITYSLACSAICAQKDMDDKAKAMALSLLAKCNADVYLGQFIDLNVLSIERRDEYISEGTPDKKFLKEYINRCHLIGGSTIHVAVMGAMAANPESPIIPALERYYEAIGVAGQIINDLADYIPEETRPYTSQYGDLRMGRFTYPTYFLAKNNHPCIRLHYHWNILVPLPYELESATQFLKDINIRKLTYKLLKIERIGKIIEDSIIEISRFASEEKWLPLRFANRFIFASNRLKYFNEKSCKV